MKKYLLIIGLFPFLAPVSLPVRNIPSKTSTPPTTHWREQVRGPHDSSRIRVIFDTDTNNEVDDQHALAYLLFNGNAF